MVPSELIPRVIALAGQGSALHEKHKLYLQHVTVVDLPESYEDRLIELFPSLYSRLRLFALDPYDLALTKLQRNASHDREDVKQLAIRVPLDTRKPRLRYEEETRPYIADGDRYDRTMNLRVEMIEEARQK